MGKTKFIEKQKIIRFTISLFLALFIWGYVTNMHNPLQEKTLSNVPINIVSFETLEAQNLTLKTSSPFTTTVVIEGRFSDMKDISMEDIEVVMDLSDLALKEGDNNIMIEVKSLTSKFRIVKESTPIQSKVEITKLIQKEFPVMVNLIGTTKDDYVVGEPVISKEKVIVAGAKEALDDIKYVSASVSVGGATEDISVSSILNAVNKVGEFATNVILKDKEVDIKMPLYYSKEVPIVVDMKNKLPGKLEIEKYKLDSSSIYIVGPKDILDDIEEIKTEELDLSRRYYDFDKRLYLLFPDNVKAKTGIASVYGSFVVNVKK